MDRNILALKQNMLSTDEMYRMVGINKNIAYEVLNEFEGNYLRHPKEWKISNREKGEDNPTCGYCHRMTALVMQKFRRGKNISFYQVNQKDPKIDHFFFILETKGKEFIIDLTRDQFAFTENFSKDIPYELAKKITKNQEKNLQKGKGATEFVEHFVDRYNSLTKKYER